MRTTNHIARVLWAGVILLALIGVAAAVRRTLVLLLPAQLAASYAQARLLDADSRGIAA